MKLKHRLVFGILICVLAPIFIVQFHLFQNVEIKPVFSKTRETIAVREYSDVPKVLQEPFEQVNYHEDGIIDEIINDVGGHLAFIRKQLSVTENEEDHVNEQTSQQVIDHLLSKSPSIHKYSDAFIRVAELLLNEGSLDISADSKHVKSNQKSHAAKEAIVTSEPKSETEIHYVYSSHPQIRVYANNVTISHLAQPFGYHKREGNDFELPDALVRRLENGVQTARSVHRKRLHTDTLDYFRNNENTTTYEQFINGISQYELYTERDDDIISDVLRHLQTLNVKSVSHRTNTKLQLRLYITLEGGMRVIFKPMRFAREQETFPDQYYFSDFERHNAEIASFHLDRLLGFRRVPPVAGRSLHMLQEIRDHIPETKLKKEFVISPSGTYCYRGDERCLYCENRHLICAEGPDPYMLEGALITYFPKEVKREVHDHPWKRSYTPNKPATWEQDDLYCAKVKHENPMYGQGRRMLDLMDLAIFDFLTGNMDRDHYETLGFFGNESFMMYTDNAKAFGNHHEDEMTCLAPIIQCCMLRMSTLETLLNYYNGPIKLSDALRDSLRHDVTSPVLVEEHLLALDRRVKIILEAVNACIYKKKTFTSVIIDDGL